MAKVRGCFEKDWERRPRIILSNFLIIFLVNVQHRWILSFGIGRLMSSNFNYNIFIGNISSEMDVFVQVYITSDWGYDIEQDDTDYCLEVRCICLELF